MASRGSAEDTPRGVLYVVATPIGNREDLSPRAAQVLRSVDVVAAEDTRTTAALLGKLGISAKLVSYHEHNERERAQELAERLAQGGQIALVSDAGTPILSDPGYHIVQRAIEVDARVVPIPGPSALLLALVGAGLPMHEFAFAGFLPRTPEKRRKRLQRAREAGLTHVFFESSHRIRESLADVAAIYDEERICVARELTKPYEEFIRGSAHELLSALADDTRCRGEFTLVLPGRSTSKAPEAGLDVDRNLLLALLRAGVAPSMLVAALTDALHCPRKVAYDYVLALKEEI